MNFSPSSEANSLFKQLLEKKYSEQLLAFLIIKGRNIYFSSEVAWEWNPPENSEYSAEQHTGLFLDELKDAGLIRRMKDHLELTKEGIEYSKTF